MSDLVTADQLATRILESRLMESKQIEEAMMAAGGRQVPAEDFIRYLTKHELLTNWQTQRLLEGHRRGYFYGNYRILYMVGHGTFARVYRAVHVKTGDVKAVKVLRNRYSDSDAVRERFLQEARTVMTLRHPNIVPIHEVATEKGRIYMVMDFVEGQNLRDYVRAHGKLKLLTALSITRDLASGLDYAFQKGITHRDMKLSNVLLSSKGQAKLVDFGLATVNTDVDDEDKQGPRSIDYAGLEKTTNAKRNDPRSDIFFLGCMLYHMICGEPPLKETRERMKRIAPSRFREIPPIAAQVPNLPSRVVILVNRLMDLNPETRIQTAQQAHRELQAAVDVITHGETEIYDPELSRAQAEEYAELIHRQDEGRSRIVMFVESDSKLQDHFREKLKEVGYRVLIISNPQSAIDRFARLDPAEPRPADCVIFGTTGNGALGLEAFNRFKGEIMTTIPAILLIDPKRNNLESQADLSIPNRRIAHLPIKMKEIRGLLSELLA